jgi:hypothetical protein
MSSGAAHGQPKKKIKKRRDRRLREGGDSNVHEDTRTQVATFLAFSSHATTAMQHDNEAEQTYMRSTRAHRHSTSGTVWSFEAKQ